jgi:hypothetical protein
MNCLSLLAATSLAMGLLTVGCSAPLPDDASGTDSSEVRVASCPASFTLTLSNVQKTPIPHRVEFDGRWVDLTDTDLAAAEDVQAKFLGASSITVHAALSQSAAGVCSYHQPSSTYSAEKIQLYSKNGRDVLELILGSTDPESRPYVNDFRIYASPTSYSPNGLSFGAAPVALNAAVGNAGSGASFITKIGSATIRE